MVAHSSPKAGEEWGTQSLGCLYRVILLPTRQRLGAAEGLTDAFLGAGRRGVPVQAMPVLVWA
jgi:hypothetical protein